MLVKFTAAACAVALLAGCASKPVISQFNGDSVAVQTTFSGRNNKSDSEAAELCRRAGKPTTQYLSSRGMGNFTSEHLYACLDS